MFDVLMNLVLRIERHEDNNRDEGEFQIAAVRVVDDRVSVDLHRIPLQTVPRPDTAELFGPTDRPGLELHVATITTDAPYFAYAIRAVEHDNSSDGMRQADRDDFVSNIRAEAQRVVDGGGRPTVDTIWLAGHEPELRDRRILPGALGLLTPWWARDDDDRIGVSARVYPDLGTILAVRNPVIDPPRPGSIIPGSAQWTELLFGEDGARWRMAASVLGRWSRP